MSAKKPIFSPGRGLKDSSREVGEDLYTGHPGYGMPSAPAAPEDERDAEAFFRGKNKGHAAYAAHDEMPSFQPRDSGLSSRGGLIPEDPVPRPGPAGVKEMLSVVGKDALAEECRARLCPECPVKKEADDMRLRAMADLDNTRKRLAREHEEQARFAAEAVLIDILPSLDNLDLALQHSGNNAACKDFITGVRMTRKLLGEALAKHGLEQVGERGEEFNPALHEAVGLLADPDIPDGHVCELLSSGHKLRDRLLRPAKVMVCKKN
jgi:molecular chaperone GrpE